MRKMLLALVLVLLGCTCSDALLLQGPTALTARAPAFRAASCSRASTLKACDSRHSQVTEPRKGSSDLDGNPFRTPVFSSRSFSGPTGWVIAAVSAMVTCMLCARWSQVAAGSLALYHAYEQAALTKPLITKGATSAAAYFLGDGLAQRFTGSGKVDVGRVSRSAFAGFISHGPQLHYWSLFLERYLSFGGAWWAFLVKIALDQTIFSLYLNGAYCGLIEVLKRSPPAEVWRRVRASALPSLYSSWRFWPLVHALTYSVVPVHLRVLWVDLVEVGWVGILSTCVARAEKASAESVAAESALAAKMSADNAVAENWEQLSAPVFVDGPPEPFIAPSDPAKAVLHDLSDSSSYIPAN